MLHSTAAAGELFAAHFNERLVIGDAMSILRRAYRRPYICSFPECETSSISSYMRHQYVTGPHRHGSMIWPPSSDSIQDGESYGCASYICRPAALYRGISYISAIPYGVA